MDLDDVLQIFRHCGLYCDYIFFLFFFYNNLVKVFTVWGLKPLNQKKKKKDHTDNYQKQNTNITKVNFTYFNYSSENSIYTKIFTSSSIVCTSSSENDEGCCVAFRCWTLATVLPSRTSSRRRRRRRVCGGSSCRREPWQAPCPAQGPPPWTG